MIKKITIVVLMILWLCVPIDVYAEEEPYDFLQTGLSTLLESNLFTRQEDYEPYYQKNMDLSNFVEIIRNTQTIMYVNPQSLAIRLKDIETGFIWASDIDDLTDYPLNAAWIRRIRSSINIDYLNENNIANTSSILQRRSADNAQTSYRIEGNKAIFDVDFHIEKIKFTYEVELNEQSIIVTLLRDSIEEYGNSRLTKVTLFEFFGSVYSDQIPGYFFIPSGNGALVRFTPTSTINNVYRARFYSGDMYRGINAQNTALNYPVFGVVHGVNQFGLFTEILQGAEYAEYVYTPPTFQTELHTQNATFYFRENYVQTLTSAESIVIYENDMKDYSPQIKYVMLKDEHANYVGFAHTLKASMIESNKLDKAYAPERLALHLDVLMKEYEQGLIFKKPYIMTSVDELLNIDNDLTSSGVDNISYTLRGYNRGGYTDRSTTNLKLDRAIGRFNRLDDLDIEYYYDPMTSYSYRSKTPSYALQMITRKYFVESLSGDEYYRFVADIEYIKKHYSDAEETLINRGGIAVDGISNKLASNKNIARHELHDVYDEMFTNRISMYRPSYYNIKHASRVYMSSLYHNRARFYTDSVPFEQILLSGYLPVYSQFLNFSSNIHVDLLKTIEYGMFPAFLITAKPSHLLSNTISRDYYATYYDNLKAYIINAYQQHDNALSHVIGHEIVGREVVANGVVRIEYSNNYHIYVNYTQNTYSEGDITVDPFDFLVYEVIV